MKIALLNDTHFGIKNDSSVFLNYFLSFFENQFFPYLKENDISTVLHLGDFLDRRKYVNFNTLNQVRSRFIEPLFDMNVDFHMLLGNHDTYYRNTNKINSAKELFLSYGNFHLHEKPFTLKLDNFCVGMVPWICEENEKEIENYLSVCPCPMVLGHFELNGHEMLRGIVCRSGRDDNFTRRFEKVISGHFHKKSIKGNVYYLGTQYQMVFNDVDETFGFHVLDTETRELEFIENEDKIFYILKIEEIDLNEYDFSKLKNKYVKVIVSSSDKKKKVNDVLSRVEKNEPYDLTIIEDFFIAENTAECVDLAKDTITIINEEIDNLDDDLDKNFLKATIKDIYLEILNDD